MQPNFTLKHLGKPMLFSFLLTLCFQGLNAQKTQAKKAVKPSPAIEVTSKNTSTQISKNVGVNHSVSNEEAVANKLQASKDGSQQLKTGHAMQTAANGKKPANAEAGNVIFEKKKALRDKKSKAVGKKPREVKEVIEE